MDYGFLALLPPIVAIILAFLTKDVVISLSAGVFLGTTVIYGWNPFLGLIKSVSDFIVPSMASEWNAAILFQAALFGIMITFLQNNGGAVALGHAMTKRMKTKKSTQIAAWCFGILIFFSDYFNTLMVGGLFRPITDEKRISREKLAYISDSTASAVCLLVPFSAWLAYVMGLIGNSYADLGISESPYLAYLKTIPYNSYAILVVVFVLIIAVTGKDFGPMLKAEKRAATGEVLRVGSKPLSSKELTEAKFEAKTSDLSSFWLPITVMMGSILPILLWSGGFPEKGFIEAIGTANGAICLAWSVLIGVIVIVVQSLIKKTFTFVEAMELVMDGIKGMSMTYVILILAWSIGSLTKSMGAANYIVQLIQGNIPIVLLPALVFLTGALISFSTGTSYGTFAILIPIAIPLAIQLDAPLYPMIAAAFSGGLFGDHCSPISDTTVMASTGAACDHIDHVRTQLPYAALCAIIAAVGFVASAAFSSGIITNIITIVCLIIALFVLNKVTDKKEKNYKVKI
jgi:Na+/H+ antiporter NhaC